MKNLILSISASALLFTASASFAAKPPENRISMEKAQAIALKKFDGKIKSSELEHEKGRWVYSFDIVGQSGQIHEILVNAKTGEIVSDDIETPAKEAAEAKADAAQPK